MDCQFTDFKVKQSEYWLLNIACNHAVLSGLFPVMSISFGLISAVWSKIGYMVYC